MWWFLVCISISQLGECLASTHAESCLIKMIAANHTVHLVHYSTINLSFKQKTWQHPEWNSLTKESAALFLMSRCHWNPQFDLQWLWCPGRKRPIGSLKSERSRYCIRTCQFHVEFVNFIVINNMLQTPNCTCSKRYLKKDRWPDFQHWTSSSSN